MRLWGTTLLCGLTLAVANFAVAQTAGLPSHTQALAEYADNSAQAAKKYDGKRLHVKAVIFSMGDSFQYFGAQDAQDNRFDVEFADGQEKIFATKLKGGKLKAFETTTQAVDFDCLNEGNVVGAIVPSLKLTDCRFSTVK